MKPSIPVLIILGILFLTSLSACSDTIFSSVNNPNTINRLNFEITAEEFTVTNIRKRPIYYFAVESSRLPFISWVAVSKDINRIDPGKQFTFLFEELWCCDEGGDISFLYWVSQNPDSEDIRAVVIDPDLKKVSK
jgi:hypothetical protein